MIGIKKVMLLLLYSWSCKANQLIFDLISDTRAMEALLKRLGRTFPQTSVVMVEIKQNLVALYRDIILREPSPSRNILQRKINLCTELLAVLKAVEPGISRLKGKESYYYII